MRPWLKWLLDKNRRDLLGFAGGGIVVVAGAAWTVFTFVRSSSETPQKIEAIYNVCIGEFRERCPPATVHLPCGQSIAAWAAHECAGYQASMVSVKDGGMCGYSVTQIKCTAGK